MIAWSKFIMAGDAIFTARSLKTGARYTFRVQRREFDDGRVSYFVKYLAGADNESSYAYIGMLTSDGIKLTAKSHVTVDSTIYKAAKWVITRLMADRETPDTEVFHAGKCCACGRTLTTPESIEMGIGPICAEKAGM